MKTDVKQMTDKEIIRCLLSDERETVPRRSVNDVINVVSTKKESLTYTDLVSIDGIKPVDAVRLLSCFELTRRYCTVYAPVEKITRPDDILPCLSDIRGKLQEHFVCVTLNGAGEVINNRVVTIGLLNHSLVHPREVFADAITDHAASIIVAHNHPSNSLEPSPQDIAITAQLKEAGALLGIQLLDHLIVTKTGHLSMRERGLV